MRLLIQYHMAKRQAQQALNKTFHHMIQERKIPYRFYNPKKPLWKPSIPFPSITSEPHPYNFLLSLSAHKERTEEHRFELLANSDARKPKSELLLVLAPNPDLKNTYSPPENDPEYRGPETSMPYYVEPIAPLEEDIWYLDLLYDFWANYPDMTVLSNQEIQAYLTAYGQNSSGYDYDALHFHLDLRILESTGCPESKGIPPGILIQTADFLARTGQLRSLHLAGSHLYPEMARQISTRVIQMIDHQQKVHKN